MSGACQDLPLGVPPGELIESSWMWSKASHRVVGTQASWDGLLCRSLWDAVTGCGVPVRSYKAIHGWWLAMLGLVYILRLASTITTPGAGQQEVQVPRDPPPPAYWAQVLKEPLAVHKLCEAGSESPSRGKWYSLGWYRFKLCASAASQSTQQKSQGTPRTFVAEYGLRDLSG